MKRSLIAMSLLASAAWSVAIAQPSVPAKDKPIPIGTTQETANKANAEAIKRGDTATVVRTGPTAAGKVSNATHKAGDSAAAATHDANDAVAPTKRKAKRSMARAKSHVHEETTRP